jgi:hypothetical protein
VQPDVKGLILLIPGTDPIMVVQGRTTAEDMPLTRAPSQLRLAIDRTIVVPGIGQAAPITFGSQGIGRAMGTFGSVGTTL